jgi:hypothetical protein
MPNPAKQVFALSFGLAAIIWAVQQANAQTAGRLQCGERAHVMAVLADKYRETRRGMGIAGASGVVELFSSDDTGSWTVTVSLPDGRTCLLASGTGWETLNEELPARADPA